jgi:hypothetical protein
MSQTCNINQVERRIRRTLGMTSAIPAIFLGVYLATSAPNYLPMYLLEFGLIFISSLGILQAKTGFCIFYGIFDLSDNPGTDHIPFTKRLLNILKIALPSIILAATSTGIIYLLN